MAENTEQAPAAPAVVTDPVVSAVLQTLSDKVGEIIEANGVVRSIAAVVDWDIPSAVAVTLPVGVWRASRKEITPLKAVEAIRQLALMVNHITSIAYRLAAMPSKPSEGKQAAVEDLQRGMAFLAQNMKREELDNVLKEICDKAYQPKADGT